MQGTTLGALLVRSVYSVEGRLTGVDGCCRGGRAKMELKKKNAVEAEHNIVKESTLQEVNQLIFGKGR